MEGILHLAKRQLHPSQCLGGSIVDGAIRPPGDQAARRR